MSSWRSSIKVFFTPSDGAGEDPQGGGGVGCGPFKRNSLRSYEGVPTSISRNNADALKEGRGIKMLSLQTNMEIGEGYSIERQEKSEEEDVALRRRKSFAGLEQSDQGSSHHHQSHMSLLCPPTAPITEKMKRRGSFQTLTSLMKRQSTTKSKSAGEEDSSEDEDDEEDEDEDGGGCGAGALGSDDGDNVTLVDLHQSTMTLCVEGADQVLPEGSAAYRLSELFTSDLNKIVASTLSMPDSPRKMAFIEEILRSLRGLRTDTTINSHFVILSSLVVQNQVIEEEEEREAPSKNENE